MDSVWNAECSEESETKQIEEQGYISTANGLTCLAGEGLNSVERVTDVQFQSPRLKMRTCLWMRNTRLNILNFCHQPREFVPDFHDAKGLTDEIAIDAAYSINLNNLNDGCHDIECYEWDVWRVLCIDSPR
jgi:hypothetical protein